MSVRRVYIRDIPIDEVAVDGLAQEIVRLCGLRDQSRYICYVNAHVYNLARKDPQLCAILNGSAICYADGTSVVWAANRLGGRLTNRMTAADFFPELVDELSKQGRRVFLLGGKPGVAERAADRLSASHEGFDPAGVHHGYFSDTETEDVIAKVRQAEPDLLVVGMGTPIQEHWVGKHLHELSVPLTWTVGALLDYIAGVEQRCPEWMGKNGLEWLHRLRINPRRMAARYLIGNPKFLLSVLTAARLGRNEFSTSDP